MNTRAWLNGKPASSVSIIDRGFQFGHGCFETIAVANRQPLLLNEHLERLAKGLKTVLIPFSNTDQTSLESEIAAFCQQTDESNFIVKVIVTMGEGARGYSNPESPTPNRALIFSPLPQDLDERTSKALVLGVSEQKLAEQTNLAGIKHCNRLSQILAKNTLDPSWDDAIMLNDDGQVIEATSSNLFIVEGTSLITPDLSNQGINGVLREKIISTCASLLNLSVKVEALSLKRVLDADEVFLTNSIYGVQKVKQINGSEYEQFEISLSLQKECVKNDFVPYP